MTTRPRILLAEALDEHAEAKLAAAAEVVRPKHASVASLIEAIVDCDALIARTHTPVTRALLEASKRLRIVGIAGVGLDRVDVASAKSLGIEVVHTPEAASDAVAELTILLMLQLLRPTPRLAQAYRAGEYHAARALPHGRELRGLTVGIIGMGRIGSRVGRIAAAGFAARVLYNDITEVGPFAFPADAADKQIVYRESDILSLHVPLTDRTRRLIDAAALGQMKPAALLINTARGQVVETDALLRALQAGRIAGAALDVTDPEPLPADHPLLHLENCITLPHIAARTHGGLRRMYDVVDVVIERLCPTR